ncbi:MAG: CoA transferase [Dehalococcoidia bacterium]|nr:CoA transferase [Dehalococcoidia bacterium]
MTLPLEGFRVLDATTWFQSVAPRMLGDLGAEVIKIESPITGDPMRGSITQTKLEMGGSERNVMIEHANFNKKCITLDLTKEEGRKILYKLVGKSDVFVHNLRMNAAIRLGVDYATLSTYNPLLIYALGSAWGSNGQNAGRASYDRLALARSGLMSIIGQPDTPPSYINGAIADHMGASMTAFGIVAALLKRERTGQGQEVECSLLGSMMHLLSMNVDAKLIMGVEVPRHARTSTPNPFWNEYRCKDDKWISLGMLQADRYWPSFCKVTSLEHLEKDQRFENIWARSANAAECIAIMDEVFATKTRAEWLDILGCEGDFVVEPVNTFSDLLEDTQVWANNYIAEFEHPTYGRTQMMVTPIRVGGSTPSIRLPSPEFGEHTEEVLQNILEYSWEDISRLKEEKVI